MKIGYRRGTQNEEGLIMYSSMQERWRHRTARIPPLEPRLFRHTVATAFQPLPRALSAVEVIPIWGGRCSRPLTCCSSAAYPLFPSPPQRASHLPQMHSLLPHTNTHVPLLPTVRASSLPFGPRTSGLTPGRAQQPRAPSCYVCLGPVLFCSLLLRRPRFVFDAAWLRRWACPWLAGTTT
jgi:hypothetical protein